MSHNISYLLKPEFFRRSYKKFCIFSLIIFFYILFLYFEVKLKSIPDETWNFATLFLSEIRTTLILALFLGLLLIYLPIFIDNAKKMKYIELMIKLKELVKAESTLFELLNNSPKNWVYLNLIARIKIEEKNWKSAFSWLNFAETQTNSQKKEILHNKALLYLLINDFERSLKINDQILQKHPSDLLAILRKLQILGRKGLWDQIIIYFDNIEKIVLKNKEIYLECALEYYNAAFNLKMDEKIQKILIKLPIESSLQAINLINIAYIFDKEKKYDHLSRVVELLEYKSQFELDKSLNDQIKIWKEFLNNTKHC